MDDIDDSSKRKYDDDENNNNNNGDISSNAVKRSKRKSWSKYQIEQAKKEDIVKLLTSVLTPRNRKSMDGISTAEEGGGIFFNNTANEMYNTDPMTMMMNSNDNNDGGAVAAVGANDHYDIDIEEEDDDNTFEDTNINNDIIDPVLPNDCMSILEILSIDTGAVNATTTSTETVQNQHQISMTNMDGNSVSHSMGVDDPTMTFASESMQVPQQETTNTVPTNVFDTMTSRQRGRAVLEFLLAPSNISVHEFYTKYWEKQPLCIRSNSQDVYDIDDTRGTVRYENIISERQLYNDLFDPQRTNSTTGSNNTLYYTRDISVTKLDKNIETGVLEIKSNDLEKEDGFEGEYNNTINDETIDDYYVSIDTEEVWDQYKNDGCIVSLSSCVQYYPTIQSLVSLLEIEFGCRVTADITLKPTSTKPKTSTSSTTNDINSTSTQSSQQQQQRKLLNDIYHFIPPKFDNTDQFKIQVEGYQRYIIFNPIHSKSIPLSRTYGGQDVYNCTNDFLTGKSYKQYKINPIIDVTLRPGDVLYIPRGYVYQCYPLFLNDTNTAYAIRSSNVVDTSSYSTKMPHSLDISLSFIINWTWIDLLEVLLPKAMQTAASSTSIMSTKLRHALPLRFLDYMGTSNLSESFKKDIPPVAVPPAATSVPVDETTTTTPAAAVEASTTADANEDGMDTDGGTAIDTSSNLDPITGEVIETSVVDTTTATTIDGIVEEAAAAAAATAETETTIVQVPEEPATEIIVYESYPINEEEVMKYNKRMIVLQNEFRKECKKCIQRVVKEAYTLIDSACDSMGVKFLTDRIPPLLSKHDLLMTKSSSSTSTSGQQGQQQRRIFVQPGSLVRLVRPGIARLTIEPTTTTGTTNNNNATTGGTASTNSNSNNKAILYHCKDNALIYHETPMAPLEFEIDDAIAIKQLLSTIEPHWICVNDLSHTAGIEEKVGVAQALYDEGILAIR